MKTDRDLGREYSQALRGYIESGNEEGLHRAYQLGRNALAGNLGVLEMAALHQEALVDALLHLLAPRESTRIAQRASQFFAESLAPFEMSQRGFREANTILRDMNQELEHRVRAIRKKFKIAREELDEHKRMEQMKNDFISVVSHELRTPLTSIHGSLGLIIQGVGGELSPEAAQLLDVAYRNSQRLVRLVSDILDLQKIESGTMAFEVKPLELAGFLEHAVEANQAYAAQFGVRFVLERPPIEVRVLADADRLMQVLTNLLSNAAKFSPRGETVRINASPRDGAARVSVVDRGPGIPREFHDRIFTRFAQADSSTTRDKGGTGLGLSISKAIVERLGGSIGFEPRRGGGTTFYFDLPECREAPEPVEVIGAPPWRDR